MSTTINKRSVIVSDDGEAFVIAGEIQGGVICKSGQSLAYLELFLRDRGERLIFGRGRSSVQECKGELDRIVRVLQSLAKTEGGEKV